MSRRSSTTTAKPSPAPAQPATADLSLDEEDAYAQLCLIANDQAPDDQRRLLPANINTPKANDTQPDDTPKTPPALPQSPARGNAIRYLLAYFAGGRPRQVMASLGITWADVQRYRWTDPQFALVQDFLERERHRVIGTKALDSLELLIEGGKGAKSINAKAVMFALERLRRESFADPKRSEVGAAGAGRGGGITYNITFAGNAPANLCGICATQQPQPQIIEVKGE